MNKRMRELNDEQELDCWVVQLTFFYSMSLSYIVLHHNIYVRHLRDSGTWALNAFFPLMNIFACNCTMHMCFWCLFVLFDMVFSSLPFSQNLNSILVFVFSVLSLLWLITYLCSRNIFDLIPLTWTYLIWRCKDVSFPNSWNISS